MNALGMMSGTSMDGIDLAIIKTNGLLHIEFGPTDFMPYDPAFREQIRACLGQTQMTPELKALSIDITRKHMEFLGHFLAKRNMKPSELDVIGFHGQTITHIPEKKFSLQVGNGAMITNVTGVPVVDNFRRMDIASGGQGAPLASLYHSALVSRPGGVLKPAAVLNIGGVANVTWIGEPKKDEDEEDIGLGGGPVDIEENLLAFDTGPGNALLDDWVMKTTGKPMDEGGKLAMTGKVNTAVLGKLLDNPFFKKKPPKSLDRNAFSLDLLDGLSPEDGAATLTAFTVESVVRAEAMLPAPPRNWVITGGGRKNEAMLKILGFKLKGKVRTAEDVHWNGDALEAQAFAFLAVRSLYGLHLSVPSTTGVKQAITGGTLHKKGKPED